MEDDDDNGDDGNKTKITTEVQARMAIITGQDNTNKGTERYGEKKISVLKLTSASVGFVKILVHTTCILFIWVITGSFVPD